MPRWPRPPAARACRLYAAISGITSEQASDQARAYAERLERAEPSLAVSRMTRKLRAGKVLIDWSQNNGSKTTVAPYSLRARQFPTVSTPVTWAEVEACRQPPDLFFTAEDTPPVSPSTATCSPPSWTEAHRHRVRI